MEETQSRIGELSVSIALARAEKAKLQEFLRSFDEFSQERQTKLPSTTFSAYQAHLLRDAQDLQNTYESHLKEIDMYVEGLVEKRATSIQELQRAAYISSVVHCLPFEVLGNIFTECAMVRERYHDRIPQNLALVGVAWRDAVFRTPTVWSNLAICVITVGTRCVKHPGGLADLNRAKTWIGRSGTTPLYLDVHWEGNSIALDEARRNWAKLIASVSHRLVHLGIGSTLGAQESIPQEAAAIIFWNSFPRLESFDVRGLTVKACAHSQPSFVKTLRFHGLSRLKSVVLHHIPTHKHQLHAEFEALEGLDSLESLSLTISCLSFASEHGPLPVLMKWLPAATRTSLRVLRLEHTYIAWRHLWYSGTAIELPNLVELSLEKCLGLCSVIDRHLRVPALILLRIDGGTTSYTPGETPENALTVLLEGTHFPSLSKFVLRNVRDIDDTLHKFLLTHDMLTSLTLNNVSPIWKTLGTLGKYPRSTRRTVDMTVVCPRLEELVLEGHGVGDPKSERFRRTFDEIIRMRYRQAHPAGKPYEEGKFARLKSFVWYGEERL